METVQPLPELTDAELEELMAVASPGLRDALERAASPEARESRGLGFNSFVDYDS
ncbi:hypothetical protein GCM10009557_85150 [Virgisporangium ochraceum]|uniref:FXSXX-COOH protein n=1 Tax=Virgisporangium ochraceum TaxID=65505 RepID=A0A8J4EF72_9ACTN|nr:hypothetical protein [Virgisporangium ochraceum]GIJ72446.1 hypothetical protein Voc01_073630 [Virgisporangium ochraceum]